MLPPPVTDEARAAHADMEAVGMAPLVYFQAHDAPARHPPPGVIRALAVPLCLLERAPAAWSARCA